MDDEVFSSDLMVPSVEQLEEMIEKYPPMGDKSFTPSYQKIMQKISSLIAFTYSGIPQPRFDSTLNGKPFPYRAFHKELYFRYQSIRLNTRQYGEDSSTLSIEFRRSKNPGIYYPFIKFFGTGQDWLNWKIANRRFSPLQNQKFLTLRANAFRNEGVHGTSFPYIKKVWNECARFRREDSISNSRPTLEGFTETYRAIREGELPNRKFVGLLPINYVQQSVVSNVGSTSTGVIRAVGEAYPNGLSDNQFLALQRNSRMTYSKGCPSCPYGYVFKLDDSDAYAILKVGNPYPTIKVYSSWDSLKNDRRMLSTTSDTAWWAKGKSVFEFEFGSRGIEIGSFNYGVDNFLLRQNT